MNKAQSLFQTHVEYPEEFHLFESPDHTTLMQLMLIKLLFTVPIFTNKLWRTHTEHPLNDREFFAYLQSEFYKHTDEILLDVTEEFATVTLDTGFPDYFCDFTEERYLTFDDHYDYVNYEIAKTMSCLPEREVTIITSQVANHLAGIVHAIWTTPDIYDRYRTLGAHEVDVTLDLKSTSVIVLIYSLPHLYHDQGELHGG